MSNFRNLLGKHLNCDEILNEAYTLDENPSSILVLAISLKKTLERISELEKKVEESAEYKQLYKALQKATGNE